MKLWGGKMWTPTRSLRLWLDWDLDHLPWPHASVYRGGDRLDVSVGVGPRGPDPILSASFSIFRHGVTR